MGHPLENMNIKWSYVYGIFTTYTPHTAASIFIFDYRIVKIAEQLGCGDYYWEHMLFVEYKTHIICPPKLDRTTNIFYAAIQADAINTFEWLVNSLEFEHTECIIEYINEIYNGKYTNEYIDILMENKGNTVPPLNDIAIKLSTENQLTDYGKISLIINAVVNDNVVLLKYQMNRYNINCQSILKYVLKMAFKFNIPRSFKYILELAERQEVHDDKKLDKNKLLLKTSNGEFYEYYSTLLTNKINPNNIDLSIIKNILSGNNVELGIIPLHYIIMSEDINVHDYIDNILIKKSSYINPMFDKPLNKLAMLSLDPVVCYNLYSFS
jgi:hypothetical protein